MRLKLLSIILILNSIYIYSQVPCGIILLTECDDGSSIDQSVFIDLTQLNTLYPFCYTNADYLKYNTPTHHDSMEDANAGINAIANPEAYKVYMTYGEEGEIIYARAEPIEMGLPVLVDIFCEVKGAEPPTVFVTDFEVLDEDDDGFAVFDLDVKDVEIASSSNFLYTYVTFHQTEDDALTDSNAIFGNYVNTLPYEQTIYVRATPDFHPSCYSIYEMKLIASNSLTTNELVVNKFLIFPNPTQNIVNIKFDDDSIKDVQINIFDIQGKQFVVSNNEVIDKTIQLNVSALSKGMYFVKVKSDNSEVVKKLIIK